MHLIFVGVLWYLIIILSKEPREDFIHFVKGSYGTYKRRKNVKNAISYYTRLYVNSYDDYVSGYYYGKIGALKAELKEAKYFGG